MDMTVRSFAGIIKWRIKMRAQMHLEFKILNLGRVKMKNAKLNVPGKARTSNLLINSQTR